MGPHVGQADKLDAFRDLEISGRINQVDVNWTTQGETPYGDSLAFSSDIDFSQLTVLYREASGKANAANGKVTGFRNLSGRFKGDDRQGEWTLNGKNAEVALPEVFAADLLAFDELAGSGGWKNVFDGTLPVEFSVADLKVRNADLQAQVAGTYEFRRNQPDFVDVRGTLPTANLAKVSNYLPLVVGQNARDWLKTNILAGVALNGQFELSGRLSDFPFDGPKQKGVFRIEVPFENGELTYAPGWPGIQKVKGKATFAGKRMLIQADTAESLGVQLKKVEARIDNLDAWEPLLVIKGAGSGELGKMVAFVNQSPVREILNEALINAEVEGVANLDLRLSIPIADPQKTQVQGDLALRGNSIRIVQGMPLVSNTDGLIRFSNKGLFIEQTSRSGFGRACGHQGDHRHKRSNGNQSHRHSPGHWPGPVLEPACRALPGRFHTL